MANNKRYDKNQRKRGNGKRPRQIKGESTAQTKMSQETSNNISWWNQSIIYPEVTRVPFNRITGDIINWDNLSPNAEDTYSWGTGNLKSISIGMRIDYVPFIGVSLDQNSGINRAFTSLYAALYAKTTGAMQFQQSDLAITVMAVDSILTNIAQVRRALGVSPLYSDANYAYPRAVLEMCGIDPESIIGKQDEVRRVLNDCIANLNAMRIPKFISVFDRHYALAHNVYLDEDNVRAQSYVFVPTGSYYYTEAGDWDYETEGLRYQVNDGSGWTRPITSVLNDLKAQLRAIRSSSSFGLIMGTISRAFPQTDLLVVDPVQPEMVLLPTFDRNIMWQINNMNAVGRVKAESMHVYSSPIDNMLVCEPFLDDKYAVAATPSHFLINSYDGTTNDEFIMESTRLLVSGYLDREADSKIRIVNSGTEIVQTIHTYAIKDVDGTPVPTMTKHICSFMETELWEDISMTIEALSHFRFAPTWYAVNSKTKKIYGPVNDIYRYTTLDEQSLGGLHDAALLSAYSTAVSNIVDRNLK